MKRIIGIFLLIVATNTDVVAGDFRKTDFYTKNALKKVEQNDYTGAIKEYNKAIKLEPEDVSFYKDRGMAKAKLELYEAAIKDYTKAIELKANSGEIYYNRGVAKYYIGDKKGALEDLKKSEKLGIKKAHKIIQKIKL